MVRHFKTSPSLVSRKWENPAPLAVVLRPSNPGMNADCQKQSGAGELRNRYGFCITTGCMPPQLLPDENCSRPFCFQSPGGNVLC
jgi:hypothetical protein